MSHEVPSPFKSFLAVGLLVMLGGLAFAVFGFNQALTYTETQGVIAKVVAGKKGSYTPTYAYLDLRGQWRFFVSTTSSTDPDSYRVGQKKTIHFNPDNPDKAYSGSVPDALIGALFLMALGLIFAAVGFFPLWNRFKLRRLVTELKSNGKLIFPDSIMVEEVENLVVNGKRPFRIRAEWLEPGTPSPRTFKSHIFYSDPEPLLEAGCISLYVDPRNPEKYAFDVSPLPHSEAEKEEVAKQSGLE